MPPLAKLFMSVMNDRLENISNDTHLRAETQAGFRARHTVEDLVLVVQSVVQHAVRTGSSLGLVFVDIRKAYDSVQRLQLWEILAQELGVDNNLVEKIKNMYFDTLGTVVGENGEPNASFSSNIGLKQGDGAAPLLFSLLFDRVVDFIKTHECMASKTR